MCISIRFKLTNTIFNNDEYSIYPENLYTVSTDNPVIMFMFFMYSLVLCWGNISNSKATWNLHNYLSFYDKMLGGQNILCPPLSKSLGGHVQWWDSAGSHRFYRTVSRNFMRSANRLALLVAVSGFLHLIWYDTPIFEIQVAHVCFFQNVQWSILHVIVIHCVNFYNCGNFAFVVGNTL